MLFCCVVYFCVQLNEEAYLVYDRKRNTEEILSVIVCLFVWCLTTHQPLWVISVKRY